MSESALDYVDRSNGWEIGIGPTIMIVDDGMGKSLTTTTGQADVYAFIFDQKGWREKWKDLALMFVGKGFRDFQSNIFNKPNWTKRKPD